MKKLWLLLCLTLLLSGCAQQTTNRTAEDAKDPAPATEAPTAPLPVEDAGIASVQIEAPELLTVNAAEPAVVFTARFTGVDPTGAPEEGRECTVALERDGELLMEDAFLLTEGETASFCVDFEFERYMERTDASVTVALRYGDERVETTIPVMLENFPDEVYAQQTGDDLPYSVEVIRNQNVVLVYGKDEEGEYTQLIHSFLCSTGWSTPSGHYSMWSRHEWLPLYHGVYGQYAIGIYGDILFHSVPYEQMSKDSLQTEEFNKLGTTASMGCIRLAAADVKWLYDCCPYGTPLHIYDENEITYARPEGIQIDLNDPRAGWDPTDPDENNPWRTEVPND